MYYLHLYSHFKLGISILDLYDIIIRGMHKIRMTDKILNFPPFLRIFIFFFISDSMKKEDSHDHEVNFMREDKTNR